jgi:hypothetical protein
MREYAAAGQVSPHVFDDLRLIEEAKARGALRNFRYVRVVGPPEDRRVVSADAPASTPRRPMVRTSSDRARRLATITRELRLAQITRSLDRGQRLAQVEAELAQARALRAGPSSHFSVEVYRARTDPGPIIKSGLSPKARA